MYDDAKVKSIAEELSLKYGATYFEGFEDALTFLENRPQDFDTMSVEDIVDLIGEELYS